MEIATPFFALEIILGIGFLVAVHEFGHFIMAKRAKVKVEVFSIGFGPAIFKFRRPNDDTEYRVSWIPLGGYVKLAGELPTEDHKPEPFELWAKTPWQKFTIFVAGVTMNFIVAVPICIVAYLIGRNMSGPYFGSVDTPEIEAGIMPGDKVVEVNGNPVWSLDEYRFEVLGAWGGNEVNVKIERNGIAQEVRVKARGSESHQVKATVNMLHDLDPDKEGAAKGFKKGDVIRSIDWIDEEGKSRRTPIFDLIHDYVEEVLRGAGNREMKFHVLRGSESLVIPVLLQTKEIIEYPKDEHLSEPIIAGVVKDSAAYGILKADDRVIEIEKTPIKSFFDLRQAIKDKAGRKISIVVEREATRLVCEVTPRQDEKGNGRLGIALKDTDTIADVQPGSFWEKAGFKPGDRLRGVGEQTGELKVGKLFQVDDLSSAFKRDQKPQAVARKVKVRVDRAGKPENLEVDARVSRVADDAPLGFEMNVHRITLSLPFGAAVVRGLKEPVTIIQLTYRLLVKLFLAQESAKNLAGPVGITTIAYYSVKDGQGNFFWLLALISINLGIINLLPLPLLDGGHMWILLLYEKIKGRPPTQKFLAVFQYAGLAFFLAMVIFVTFHDIRRLIFGFN